MTSQTVLDVEVVMLNVSAHEDAMTMMMIFCGVCVCEVCMQYPTA